MHIEWLTFAEAQEALARSTDTTWFDVVCWGGPKINETPPKVGGAWKTREQKST